MTRARPQGGAGGGEQREGRGEVADQDQHDGDAEDNRADDGEDVEGDARRDPGGLLPQLAAAVGAAQAGDLAYAPRRPVRRSS